MARNRYSAIVYKYGDKIIAEDGEDNVIDSGSDATEVIQNAIHNQSG